MTSKIHDFHAKTINGDDKSLGDYEGQVMLIVNTASKCGFTPQYDGLEVLHKEFADQGLAVLGFPCNQFSNQEPGAESEIQEFCRLNYGVTFQMFEKIDVNGPNAHPLFTHLRKEARGILGTEKIKWNFTKFLVDRQGKVVARFAPNTKPEELIPEVRKLLSEST